MRTRPGARPQAEHLSHSLGMVTVSPGGRRRVVNWVLRSSWGSLAVIPVIPGQPAGEGPSAAGFHSPHLCGFHPGDPGSLRQGPPQLWASCLHRWGLLATDRGAPMS